ncbi:MAG: cyclase family protein [Candidatus Velthaea sp.]
MRHANIPRYAELPVMEKTGEHHAWACFGERDELGTTNFIGPEQVRAALHTVTEGRVVNLALPLDVPQPALSPGRKSFTHHLERGAGGSDDHLDGFFLQCSSQWDALSHIRYREFGYYGGRQDADLDRGALGIDALARKGIVGRGVLVDFARYNDEAGTPLDATARRAFTPDDIDSVLRWAGTAIKPGDILVFRTGWLRWYLNLTAHEREAVAGTLHNSEGGLHCPGLAPGIETAAWLWDHRVAAVAADNPALEALQIRRDEGFLHRRILALLGMPIGEFWYLEELSYACNDRGRADFFLTSAPLNLPKGVGSPNNAYAIV